MARPTIPSPHEKIKWVDSLIDLPQVDLKTYKELSLPAALMKFQKTGENLNSKNPWKNSNHPRDTIRKKSGVLESDRRKQNGFKLARLRNLHKTNSKNPSSEFPSTCCNGRREKYFEQKGRRKNCQRTIFYPEQKLPKISITAIAT